MKYLLLNMLFLFSQFCLADSYLRAEFLSQKQSEKKWGIIDFKPAQFKSVNEKEKGAMAADLLKKNLYVGKEMLLVRREMGAPDSYFFSDTIYAYRITEPAENKESWHLIFIPDDKLEKVKEVKIHKKCCYNASP